MLIKQKGLLILHLSIKQHFLLFASGQHVGAVAGYICRPDRWMHLQELAEAELLDRRALFKGGANYPTRTRSASSERMASLSHEQPPLHTHVKINNVQFGIGFTVRRPDLIKPQPPDNSRAVCIIFQMLRLSGQGN